MSIFLCRHGETFLNQENRKQGQIDNEKTLLTEEGRLNVEKIISSLKENVINQILCSPLKRSVQTATLISNALKDSPKIIIDKGLVEMSFGIWEGLTDEEIKNKFPKYYAERKSQGKLQFKIPSGESYSGVFARVRLWWKNNGKKLKENSLIVGHDVFIRGLMVEMGELTKEQSLNFRPPHGKVWTIQ